MTTAEDVLHIYQLLADHNIPIWLTGGWGIDALLGEQTRPHKDLDVLLRLDDMVQMQGILAREGYHLKELWSENRGDTDSAGNEIATAFVLHDAEGREFDAHAIRLDADGNGLPTWEESADFTIPKDDLSGVGTITGVAVQCLTPEAQKRFHTGYELPEKHREDLRLLDEKFGLAYPD